MQFDYPLLLALAAVIREGTFEAAARSLRITQSAVSQRIKLLEEKTGAVLIVRGRPCVATEYGQFLYRHVETVQLLEHDLQKNLSSIRTSEAGAPAVIRIAVNSDSLATWFPEVVQKAGNQLNLHLDIIPDDQEYTADRLRNGEALAAITAEAAPLHGCRIVPLGNMEYVATATPRYMAKYFRDGVTMDAIRQAPHLVYDRKDQLPAQWLSNALGDAAPLVGHWMPSFTGYLACMLNGAGWGMNPINTVSRYIASGDLVELYPGTSVIVPLYWQSSAPKSEIMNAFSSIVVEVARKELSSSLDRESVRRVSINEG
ncbi:MAG: LysR family transcriptional regulator ArgP [Pseudomonadota bacterium]